MTDYNSGDWYGWNGGECPVHPETLVDTILMNGSKVRRRAIYAAGNQNWIREPSEFDIVAFRVVEEYKGPREVYLSEWRQYNLLNGKAEEKNVWSECSPDTPGAVLFREVIE